MNLKRNENWQNYWLLGATFVVLVASIFSSQNALVVISSIAGVIYVICISYKDKYAYIFGFVNVILYGVVLLMSKTYAGAVYNLLYSAPMMVYGFIYWNNHQEKDIRVLPKKAWFFLVPIVAVLFFGLVLLLRAIGGNQLWLDGATTCLGIVAIFLMTNMFFEQWWFWILGNILNLVLWLIRTIQDISNLPLLIMWIIYTINSIIGICLWKTQIEIENSRRLVAGEKKDTKKKVAKHG